MKSKKKILIIASIILFAIGTFILFKAACYGVYKSSISEIDNLENILKEYRNSEELTVTSKDTISYLEYDGYRIGNYFEQFQYDEEASREGFSVYYQYKEEKKSGMFSVGTYIQLVEAANKDDISIYSAIDGEEGLSFSGLLYSGFEDYIKRNNIKDDADLIKSFSKYDLNKEISIFTPLNEMREDFSIKMIASIVLPSIDKVYYLNGDIKGYILENVTNNGKNLYKRY